MELTVALEESRYDRQERITWWDQGLLEEARVLVVGAGALGNEVVKNLALLGVGSIVIIDFDDVEMSNLSRCVFFRPEDEGRPKAHTLAERAHALNPAVRTHGLVRDIRSFGTGLGLRADVIVGALDSREARLVVNRLAWRCGRPWVDGAIEALSGTARVFSPPRSCYECTLSEADLAFLAHRQSCRLLSRDDLIAGKVPTTATSASVIGGLQAQEVVKIIHAGRGGVTPLNGGAVLDGANNDLYVITYPYDEDCPAHHTFDAPIEIEFDKTATFRSVVEAAGFETALVELGDDHLTGWRCPRCERTDDARAVVAMLSFTDAECPSCGEPRQPLTTATVPVPGDQADVPLADFAVRADEILAVRHGTDYRYVWARSEVSDLPEDWQ